MDQILVKKVTQAIRVPERWYDVLGHIVVETGSTAASITLRDKKSCKIIFDEAFEKELNSTRIYGLSSSQIQDYLTNLRDVDPWVEVQKNYYPNQPTLMSDRCPFDEIQHESFRDWLLASDIDDTIVFELALIPGYWIAFNLFVKISQREQRQELLLFINTISDYLREAWLATQELMQLQQANNAILDQLSNLSVPTCIITQSTVVLHQNAELSNLSDQGVVQILKPSNRLCVAKSIEIVGKTKCPPIRKHSDLNDARNYRIHCRPFNIDPIQGKHGAKFWLLTFIDLEPSLARARFDELSLCDLTAQERNLFEAVRNGASVEKAGVQIGVRRSRTFEIWHSVKSKLHIENAYQIRWRNR